MNIVRRKKAQAPLEITGQALLELALFGSILIMLIGIILNYGLRYNFEQKTSMSAFRKALAASNNPNAGGQASVTVVQDKHIPNPTNPFAVGSVSPFISSASVVRNYKMQETADTYDELPQTTFQIQDKQYTLKTAGFRDENLKNITSPEDKLKKYKEIYGDVNVWEPNPGSGIYRIIDSCEGEIISFDSCKRQCRMITNVDFCVRECERGKEPGSSKDCNSVCNQQIEAPWYCAPGALENVFNFAIAKSKPKTMGLQPDYTKQTVMSNSLRKQESGGAITTTDSINWSDTTTRKIVSIDQQTHEIKEVPVTTSVGETATQTCQNGVCQ